MRPPLPSRRSLEGEKRTEIAAFIFGLLRLWCDKEAKGGEEGTKNEKTQEEPLRKGRLHLNRCWEVDQLKLTLVKVDT